VFYSALYKSAIHRL